MKHISLVAGLAVALILMPACKNGQNKASVPFKGNATEIVDSIKVQAMDLFKAIRAEQSKMIQGATLLPENIRVVPSRFFMPLDASKNAVTLAQQCALIGVYSVDNQYDKLCYGTTDVKLRNNELVKLSAQANLQGDAQSEVERLNGMSQEDFNAEVDKMAIEKFEQALEDNDADCYLIILLYSVVESALDQEAVFEAKNGYIDDEQIVSDIAPMYPTFSNVIQLVEILKPYYSTLNIIAPMVDKLKAVINADTPENKSIATLNAFDYAKEMRGRLNVSVNAD
ncbi:MAG: hypothetical protein MJY71_04350 [Bacteroidaceae bacterium]|nr:hypothetical protein [Bacteroidaceae bacterium]